MRAKAPLKRPLRPGSRELAAQVGRRWQDSNMRSNCALYVDAGYLLASAATRITGTSLRNGIHVEDRALIQALVDQAEQAWASRCSESPGSTLQRTGYRLPSRGEPG